MPRTPEIIQIRAQQFRAPGTRFSPELGQDPLSTLTGISRKTKKWWRDTPVAVA